MAQGICAGKTSVQASSQLELSLTVISPFFEHYAGAADMAFSNADIGDTMLHRFMGGEDMKNKWKYILESAELILKFGSTGNKKWEEEILKFLSCITLRSDDHEKFLQNI